MSDSVQECRELLGSLIREVRNSPNKEYFMYGSDEDLSRQWLKPLYDLCYEVELLRGALLETKGLYTGFIRDVS